MLSTGLKPRKKMLSTDFSLAIINVIFLLLFFFILTGSVIQSNEMTVAPPFTEKLPLERLPRPLISISEQNTLYLDGSQITLEGLLSKINADRDTDGNEFSKLNILADGELSARIFLVLVDRLRLTGIPVRIVTVRSLEKERPGS